MYSQKQLATICGDGERAHVHDKFTKIAKNKCDAPETHYEQQDTLIAPTDSHIRTYTHHACIRINVTRTMLAHLNARSTHRHPFQQQNHSSNNTDEKNQPLRLKSTLQFTSEIYIRFPNIFVLV